MGNMKHVFGPYDIIVGAAMNAPVDNSSNPTNIKFKDRAGITAVWTGNPTGTFQVMGSMTGKPGSFAPLLINPQNPAGAPGTAFFDLTTTAAFFVFLKYTPTSGNGSLTASIGGRAS